MSTLHRHFRIALLSLIAACGSTFATDVPVHPIDGEYLCNDCHGYLTVKRKAVNVYQVRWVVGDGSCGGVAIFDGPARFSRDALEGRYKGGKTPCVVRFAFSENGLSASDSCVSPEDEGSSTCAVIGTYSKRKK
ncbi:hypothetical protein ACQ859_20520 [Roseateles chitinivorans]|uniref:hypothetical protein n=1 Tax=Roseateles chitinivorans TaxID=2917965 RepID=UPI003D670B3F